MRVKGLYRYPLTILGLFMLVLIPLSGNAVYARSNTASKEGTLVVTLDAGNYKLLAGDTGARIEMEQDFGTFNASGEPQLPGRTFMIALPPGVKISQVSFSTPEARDLPGKYDLAPVEPSVTDGEGADQARAQWALDRQRAYGADKTYPTNVGEYRGQGQWRGYTIAQVSFQPFQYRPLSGALSFHPRLTVTIDYRLPQAGSPAWLEAQGLRGDHVLDDLIATQVVNFDQAQAWYATGDDGPTAATSAYDYVIVVQNDTIGAAFTPFKTWKESLGHSVNIVTLTWINANYTGVDVAERIWNFLHEKYPASAWGIRYVMLVGDLQVIPTRRVYYADQGWGLRSDHFYAKLSGGSTSAAVWNHDGDVRWGEVHEDEMTLTPDVLVGRIPLNNTSDITNAVNAMIAYEQDKGGWKHSALLAGGYNDIKNATSKTDNAVLMEMIRNNLLNPNGWSYTRLYEESGLGTSTYSPAPDYDASNANVVTAWNAKDYGLAILANHGNEDGLSGVYWQFDSTNIGTADDKEVVWSDLFLKSDVPSLTNTHTPIVELVGCSSIILEGPPWPNPDQTMSTYGTNKNNTGSELLAHGRAAGVVGLYSPGPYVVGWSKVDQGGMSTIGYYMAEDLVQNHYSLGWSVFDTKIRYNAKFYNNNYEPYHWALNLYGDPSMVLEGYDMSARGTNKTIHTGAVYAYGTDNDDNGDMYVAVSTQPSDVDGTIIVYKSIDHGLTWNTWATVGHTAGILAVDVIVGHWSYDEMIPPYLHVFFSDTSGGVYDDRIKLSDPGSSSKYVVVSEGPGANITALSAARDPVAMPSSAFYLYLTWQITSGSSHQVKAAYGTNNGTWWSSPAAFSGYWQPHIDAGPDNHVYLVATADTFPNDVSVKRSLDQGTSWGDWKNLTSGDSADYHAVPVVAASTDPGAPTVWVAYNYYHPVATGGGDVRFAYSADGGDNWTMNLPLSVERGVDELNPDMVGYRTDLNQWMNLAYDNDQSTGTQVMWRWSSGSTPNTWWSPRPVNDHATQLAFGPQIIYSPGAPVTGSGVVYPGTGSPITGLYFAAPWLTSAALAAQPALDETSSAMPVQGLSPALNLPLNPTATAALPPFWGTTAQLPEAFRVASLARNQAGLIFAAATTSAVNEANTGTVFRSADSGASWEPTQSIPDAWWLDSLLVSQAGALLAGGTAYSPGVPGASEHGIIYRSTNNGDGWSPAIVLLNETVVHSMLQRASGQLLAGTGPNGVILTSGDDGQHWVPLGSPPSAGDIYALWETGSGVLYAGGARADGHGVIYQLVGNAWQDVGTLSGIAAVYSLTGQGSMLYAGVTTEAGAGQVIRTPNNGATWETLPGLPTSQAVRALLNLSGTIYAGLDAGNGPYNTSAYQLPPGATSWQPAGTFFMADAVYGFLRMPDGKVFAASGNTYGVVFWATSLGSGQLYLPTIRK